VHRQGKVFHIGQGNNVLMFSSLGLAALLAQATSITSTMIGRASFALAEAMLPGELERSMLYPDVERLREVSAHITTAVVEHAAKDGVATAELPTRLREFVTESMWCLNRSRQRPDRVCTASNGVLVFSHSSYEA
jgi:malate dehydrogenase (oxaloacetate-decarboxylating)(NADP+)